jgi:hypothetical protein
LPCSEANASRCAPSSRTRVCSPCSTRHTGQASDGLSRGPASAARPTRGHFWRTASRP